MYFNPLTQFVKSLVSGKRGWARRVRRPLTSRERRRMGIGSWTTIATPAELLEERAMLSGPQLVTIAPNTGGFLANGQVTTEAPKELTFTFSPGSSIDQNTLAAGISITRSGADSIIGNGNDQPVIPGFMGVAVSGNGNNQVTLRFADTLPDDLYRISITGALKNTLGESFNSGITQTLDFRVDYGSQVISLVPQPVLRAENLNVLDISKVTDLDKFTITAGGAPVTFQLKKVGTPSVVGAGNIAVLYTNADTAATLAGKVRNAINTQFGPGGAVAASTSGASVILNGDAFTPTIKVTAGQAAAFSITEGGLSQKRDTIVAYFNQNPLNPTLAQDPGFYRVINTADGSILLPTSVAYNSASNTAVLKFGADIPAGTFHLTIGAPNPSQNTLGTAANVGTLFGNTGGFTTTAFLGNGNHQSNDVDLYKFQTGNGTNITIDASQIAAGLGSVVYLRLFDATGAELAHSDPTSLATPNQLIFVGTANTTYYVGVSSVSTTGAGNKSYNPTTGAGAAGGIGTGSYKLSIQLDSALTLNNDTTSFATSTNLGTLGAAGHTISDAIAPLGNLAYPQLPGSNDEPGHRESLLGENNGAGTGVAPVIPVAIPTYYYNFQDVYGQDPQGNTLHNAITENQKQRAREVLDIYSQYLGVKFVETLDQGLTIVTGDIRAVGPGIPPDAVGGISEGSMFGRAIMNGNLNYGNSEYGGNWFAIAFHEIGHSLGLEHSYDAPSVMGQGVGGNSGVEPVYPGDVNLVPAMRLNPPQSTDLNLYQFNVTQSGLFSAEIIAQRLRDVNGNDAPSLFDSVVTLYKETNGVRTIVARNDDYFGRDSFVSLHLDPGIYYIAVSSTGNTGFDPAVSNTGFGGRTDGDYDLKLNFVADPIVGSTLNDAGGVALDGDGNAATGGVFNFWFNSNTAANTIFVDKANSAGGQNGSIANPYSTIAAALAAATPGKVVRIVGNGGSDGDGSTLGDNKAYLIGFDSLGNAAADGSEFKIPQGVTVMIDAGAVLKLRSAIIDVGASVPNVDRSGGALQVLGTPTNNVVFTSLRNNSVAGNTDPTNFLAPSGGNWGGLVFRQASDVQGFDYQNKGIFLNSVNQANITYGGGQVLDDSVLQVFNPIHLSNPDQHARFFARPAIWNNTLTLNANAAVSADPNSFFNSLDRVGPEIHGNRIVNNSINGLFIRVSTPLGQGLQKLEVPARIDETDITYVLTENLLIEGTPGGPYQPNPFDINHTGWDARVAGSLVIDPGIILKLSGAHIQAQIGGSQLIAEGSIAHPVIFTSLRDDTFGAGGTFDAGNDGKTAGAAGDWGGLFFNSTSSGSIDHAEIRYGGGNLFNAIEIQQAQVRITNSLFQNNANGDSGGDGRNGLLTNGPATIFVRGAQPVIVQNTFVTNAGNVLSVNVNALNSLSIADWGRSTGTVDAFSQFVNNHGPLVRLNRYSGNGTNGMEVRGEKITTESTWDDTDIVHVVRTEIRDTINLHTYGGIRLQSDADASLVIKLLGANAGFTINGTPLDINDRVGGTLQVIGAPGHPVILTSLKDDSVGAGFLPNGQPLKDTNGDGNATLPQPGDWRSLLLDRYSNDRNLAVYLEREQIANQQDTNGTPATAEFIGNLAPDMPSDNPDNHKAGNDDQPLGFEVHGFLNKPTDVDVYSFNATGRTEVWFDLGRTSSSLDSIVELIDANGNVLASSNDSQNDATLGGAAMSLIKDPMLGGDFYTTNPRDAGFRMLLPGAPGAKGTYFVRVRSNNGLTQGEYQLQIRLQQAYEHPGSTVRYSDIRYATNGIEIRGLPGHSAIGGDSTSTGTNSYFGSAQPLGNLLASDRNTISVGGSLNSAAQVDWYKFELNYDLIQSIGGVNGADKTWATIFDIDYADGTGRGDLTLSVFDESGKLIFISRDSNVSDDQPGALQGNGLTDVTRGSVGKLDPFMGSVQLPAGTPASAGGSESGPQDVPGQSGNGHTYYVAISSNTSLPQVLNATVVSGASNALIRLEPVSSVQRIVEDHIGDTTGYQSGSPLFGSANIPPKTSALLPINTVAQLNTNVIPFSLGDVVMYNASGNQLETRNPSDGSLTTIIKSVLTTTDTVADIKYRSDGKLYGYMGVNVNGQNTAGRLVQIDPVTGAFLSSGNDNIPDAANPLVPPEQLTTNSVDAFAWVRNDHTKYDLYYSVQDVTGRYPGGPHSRLYRADPDSGTAAVTQGQPWGWVGEITGPGVSGFTAGMDFVGNQLFGVSSNGQFYSISLGGGTATLIADFGGQGMNFTGLTRGPENLQGGPASTPGYYKDKLFATTTDGRLICLDTSGTLLPVFSGGSTSTIIGQSVGIAFSPLDFNLWHPTYQRSSDAGHGINGAPDNSRPNSGLNTTATSDVSWIYDQSLGAASFYFGLEDWIKDGPARFTNYLTYNGVNAQYGIQSDEYMQDLTKDANDNPLVGIADTYNLPGGAQGKMITNSFDLAGYAATDKPTLYFNYFLNTQGIDSRTVMRDSARVFVTTDDGATWTMLATNNSVRSDSAHLNELPTHSTASQTENTFPSNEQGQGQRVQELFDNTNGWRQARIDLGEYAGLSNLKLRFEFSTTGTSMQNGHEAGLPGDFYAIGESDKRRGEENSFEGFYIDDIVVGLAGRGEMVTGANAGSTSFFEPNPGIQNDPLVPKQSLTGAYQLEIRRGTEYAANVVPTASGILIYQLFDENTRLANGFSIAALAGSSLADGQTFTITDGVKSVTFEFNSIGSVTPGNQPVSFSASDDVLAVARSIRDSINTAAANGLFTVTAALGDDTITGTSSTNPRVDLYRATNVSSTGSLPDATISINKTSISENGGSATGTVSIPQALGADLVVSLAVLNPATGLPATDITVPASVTILAGQTSANFAIGGVNDALFNNTRTVIVKPTVGGYGGVAAPLDVTDDEVGALVLSINNSGTGLNEGSTRTVTVTRNTPTTSDLTVNLASLNPGDATVPSSIIILAGQTSASFSLTAVQDNIVDGDRVTTLVASAAGYAAATDAITIVDSLATGGPALNGIVRVRIDNSPIGENGGSTSAQVELVDFAGNPFVVAGPSVVVQLTANIPGLANFPASVTIVAGQSMSSIFNVTAINNAVAAGNQTLIVRPTTASAFRRVGSFVDITDDDSPALNVAVFDVTEGGFVSGTVSRNTATNVPLFVTLYSTDPTEGSVPTTVVILPGQTTASFTLSGVQDYLVDGTRSTTIVASAPGYASARDLVSVFDSGVPNVEPYNRLGDRNLPRQQGSIQISSNTISNVSQTGILVDAGQRDGTGNANLPHPGSVLNGPTLNNERLVPGPQIANNVIFNFGQTGILFSGDSNATGAAAAASYGRIVNNSVFGSVSNFAGKSGIVVSENAAPTIINNIVANTETGVSIDGSSASRTVLRTTLFKNNTNNGAVGLNSISLGNAEPLFVNAATGNFYLAPGSKAIDSSLNTEQDRASIIAVKSPLDIPQSPVIAPELDRFGQLRIDEPNVQNAQGLGLNIFKDRGALERADFAGPSAGLVVPLDNGPDDGNGAVGTFFMTTPVPLSEIDIELTDVGIGIDPATVFSGAFILKQDGVTLVDGVDYIFTYNANTGRVAFLSVSVFPSSSTYTVNVDTNVVKDFAGNAIQSNQPDGSLLFTIIGNGPPVLTAIATLPGLKNIPRDITFAELKAASDLSVVTGHTPQFRIESVTSGSLTITHNAVTTPVVPGTTLFVDGDTLTWTPPLNATGVTAAFTVVGFDPENALIAPALQLSSPAVSVNVNLVNVGPVLTTISTLPGAQEDTNFLITYNTLKNASDLSDANNDSPLFFQIMGVLAGSTLEISVGGGAFAPVTAGTTLFGPGDVLRWKGPLNQNNELNGNNPFNAFSVLGTDGQAISGLTPIVVKIDVAPVADAPILTTLTKFGLGGLNSQFPILFTDLVSHSDVQNVDGHEIKFRIESIAPGASLSIKHLGVVSPVVPGTATAIVVAGDSLFWTPPLGVFGAAVNAFNIVAFDSVNASPFDISSPQITAKVEVINSPAPTLSTITKFTRPRFVPTPLTFDDLKNASNVTVAAGHTLGFRIETLDSGSATITHNGVTSAAGVGTIILAGDTLTWTSAPGATGVTNAFKVLAVDLTNTLASLDPVQVCVDLVNVAPTLSNVATFGGAIQQTPFNITYAMLQAAANEFDANNDVLGFRIRVVQNGTLTITKAGTNTAIPVVQAQTLVQPGDLLTWTGAVGATGNISAFSIRAFDGLVGSGVDIPVTINAAAFGTQFSLSGPWVVAGKLARINQVGANLTYSDQNNLGSTGTYTSLNTITGRGGLTGVIDLSTPDYGRIVWSDGAIWLKLTVGGQYFIQTTGEPLVKVIQNGVAFKFFNRVGDSADASFISPTTISIPKWNLTGVYADGAITLSNGVVWKKLDLSPTYTESVSGLATGVRQSLNLATNAVELTFTDTVGGTSKGFWNSPTQVTASDWGSIGTVLNGQILWTGGVRNGETWNKNLRVVGTGTGAGPGFVTLTATNNQILMTNKVGQTTRIQLIDPYTLYNIDTGRTIIRKNGKLDFGGGLIWADFDFNALDAVFSDIRSFPFGS